MSSSPSPMPSDALAPVLAATAITKKKRTRPAAGEPTRRGSRERTVKERDDSIRLLSTTESQPKTTKKKKSAEDPSISDISDDDFEPQTSDESEGDDEDTDIEFVGEGPVSATASVSVRTLAPIFQQARKVAPAPNSVCRSGPEDRSGPPKDRTKTIKDRTPGPVFRQAPKRKADEAAIDDDAGKGKSKKAKKIRKKRSLLPAEPSASAPATRSNTEKTVQENNVQKAKAQEAAAVADESDVEGGEDKPRKRSVIKIFFNEVNTSAKGKKVEGHTYWKCIRCKKIESIKGSTGNLKTHITKHHANAAKLLQKMLDIAKEKGYDALADDLIEAAKTKTADIESFFETGSNVKAKPKAQPFSQDEFINRLIAWLIVGDQPFSEVNSPEFRALLHYLKHDLNIPRSDAIREKIMEFGEGLDDDLRKYLSELKGKIHVALDAWTSSTGFAFLAVTGHYVKNDGQLEEMLLDFIEMEGRHTGEHMGDLVYGMLERLGITKKTGCFTLDNASNNDTTLLRLRQLFTDWEKGAVQLDFDEKQRRIRCLAHIIHLAALELLYALKIFKPTTAKQTQEEFEAEYRAELGILRANETTLEAMAGVAENDEEVDFEKMGTHAAAVGKLRAFVKKIKESPLKKQALHAQVKALPLRKDGTPVPVLAMILDVKTRWSSTHRMLERALPYRTAIDAVCQLDPDFNKFRLTEQQWDDVTTISGWLFWFRRSLEQIEAHKRPTLSLTIPIFNGLLTRLTTIKRELIQKPHSPALLIGLDHAYNKLAQYYMHTDSSFFYTWATFLDPRFKTAFFASRPEYAIYKTFIEACELQLEEYFEANYTPEATDDSNSQAVPPSPEKGGADDDITHGFFVKAQAPSLLDQWRAYRDSPREDGKVDVLNYWQVRSGQWPELARFAQDVISIPATAVSVERIFSGGRDTLSLRRASMLPGTLSRLMRLKHWIRLLRQNNLIVV